MMGPHEPLLRSPCSTADWETYFDLRRRVLRQPWGQPRGSERDSEDKSAFHLFLTDPAGKALACGRLRFKRKSFRHVFGAVMGLDISNGHPERSRGSRRKLPLSFRVGVLRPRSG